MTSTAEPLGHRTGESEVDARGPSVDRTPGRALAPRPPIALALGGLVAAIVDIVFASLDVTFPHASVRVLHAIFDVALSVAVGLFLDAVLFALDRGARRFVPRAPRIVFFVAYAALGGWALWEIVERVYARQSASLFSGKWSALLYAGFTISAGLGLPILHAIAAFIGRFKWTFPIGIALGIGGLIANQLIYPDDYAEGHVAGVWASAMMLGASAAPRFARLVERARERRGPWLALRLAAFACLALAIVAPPNDVRVVSFETAGSAAHYVLALTVWRLPHPDVPPDPRVDAAWLAAPQGPPRTPDPLSSDGPPPVVVLVTIDATRADVVMDPEHLAHLPTFSRLMREGVTFTEARSPGSQTAVSLTSLFSGKYFSGLRWERFGVGKNRFEYAAHDETPRLPSLLDEHGIPTFKVVSLAFLTNEYGVAPGFAEEIKVTTGRRHATATEVTTPLLDRLRKAKGQPLFAFVHLTEPHAPYDRGAVTEGTPFDCYVSEIEVADAYLGRILKTLESKDLARRAVLIVSSDHGEAFGEHGTWHHTKTIYEELLRVPLIVWGAGVSPRRVDVPVTLLDLGPTILDIFNQPTPSTWAGESLVPFLRGGAASPTRPILAEGRLRKALFVGDTKLLVDTRRKTIEVYDLASDPGEEHNLWDDDPDRYAPLLSALFAYGAAHDYRAPGYDPVYKP